ncbi:ABC transporter permease [Caulobacter sp. S45]|uniref:ABC transporter permease n=1 Tax=Caulobacter sp. S45 TaxID=1641861 RepID=UPI001575CA38|nr:ABC transporter permease [Caulobacter sp. S45]
MRRVWMIARREYLSYLRTAGFWVSLAVVPLVVGYLTLGGVKAVESAAPPPRLAIVDLSHSGFAEAVPPLLAGPPIVGVLVPGPASAFGAKAPAAAALQGALADRSSGLDVAAVVSGSPTQLRLDVWSRESNDPTLAEALQDLAANRMRQARLKAQGVSPALVESLTHGGPELRRYSVQTHAQLTAKDQTPVLMAMYMALLLLVSLMTAAGILLNGVIEEKSGRILEVLMSSASIPEILAGKILGCFGLTLTVLAVWAAFGLGVNLKTASAQLGPEWAAMGEHGLGAYFILFFITGYLMYASIFATIGAFCETAREAQTLLGPLMILLAVPTVFLLVAVQRPDAPVVTLLSLFPPFTPFLMPARIAAGVAGWQAVAGLLLISTTAGLVVWLCGRAFRAGALSGSGIDLKRLVGGAMRHRSH